MGIGDWGAPNPQPPIPQSPIPNPQYIYINFINNLITINNYIFSKLTFLPKFLSNYKIPGFYDFYKNLSDYLNNNITIEYFNNEKKLREYFKSDSAK